jgi:hypothetical protein
MRKFLLSAFVVIFSCSAFSQVRFAFFAGPQATGVSYKVTDQKQKSELKYGAMVGANLEVEFEKRLLFVPTLFYSMKGYKVTLKNYVYPPDTAAVDNNTTIHTVELGALLQYNFSEDAAHVFIRFGPSLDFRLFGKEQFHLKNGNLVDRKMKFSFSGDYGPVCANFLVHLGYETASGFFFFGQYTQGLTNGSNEDYGPNIIHKCFGITFGKYFHGKKIVIDTRNKE